MNGSAVSGEERERREREERERREREQKLIEELIEAGIKRDSDARRMMNYLEEQNNAANKAAKKGMNSFMNFVKGILTTLKLIQYLPQITTIAEAIWSFFITRK